MTSRPCAGAPQHYGTWFTSTSSSASAESEGTRAGYNNETPGGHGYRCRIGLAGAITLVVMVAAKTTLVHRNSADFDRGGGELRSWASQKAASNLAEVGGSGHRPSREGAM